MATAGSVLERRSPREPPAPNPGPVQRSAVNGAKHIARHLDASDAGVGDVCRVRSRPDATVAHRRRVAPRVRTRTATRPRGCSHRWRNRKSTSAQRRLPSGQRASAVACDGSSRPSALTTASCAGSCRTPRASGIPALTGSACGGCGALRTQPEGGELLGLHATNRLVCPPRSWRAFGPPGHQVRQEALRCERAAVVILLFLVLRYPRR